MSLGNNIENLNTVFLSTNNQAVRRLLRSAAMKLVNEAMPMISETVRLDRLTAEEIRVGEKEGKIPCIKMVRSRPVNAVVGLKEARDLVENEFSRLGKFFYGY
jgi:ribosomal protein L7/L12